MREIKFRAWFTLKNKMVEHKNLDLFYEQGQSFTFAVDRSTENENGDSEATLNHVIMQYTGLKDKNGKEIYEGDVIQHPTYYETPEFGDNPPMKSYVVFENGAFRFFGDIGLLYNEYEAYDGDFEVIGNIYENPELVGDHS